MIKKTADGLIDHVCKTKMRFAAYLTIVSLLYFMGVAPMVWSIRGSITYTFTVLVVMLVWVVFLGTWVTVYDYTQRRKGLTD